MHDSVWPYVGTFLASLAVDLLPVVGPPAWTVMVFMMVKFDLNPWLVLAVGVPASMLGRYSLSLYVPMLLGRIIKPAKTEEMKFLGRKLNGSLARAWTFVALYSLLPLNTTALFSAAGLARIKPVLILPPFFAGKFISDAVMLFSGNYALKLAADPLHGLATPRGVATMAVGVAILAAFLFLDWRLLLERRKLRLNFRIWQ